MPINQCQMNCTDFRLSSLALNTTISLSCQMKYTVAAKVEEEMLMRKFYELMTAHGLNKKKGFNDNADERQNGLQGAAADVTNGADERQNEQEGAIIYMTNGDH
ncbi:uncharacterized protein [Nicotiana sylvestris]|uniref:Uncharacterized protein isoform X1 n=2 Tax=Nicotiana TaxID=4085 RepID=A0A1S4AF63_TOBAC|nr:PREDICTED: uncharacterized protein LOC104210041 isoform X1 [Nicotiana sylvestris]XP_016475310.1 PREDICTED: uncharacterized protein LOC107796994 isoform X1 [Nicotiana tabacum]XP_016475311.1 PREDICTED: uncharacterized protein LOC107796994 isoform X1 [Nicotiana tabacum]XP_016475312.1 PREDICTED: uncharacterized protein LOC107796994 isoform X1 [Nicotiana tabacum]